MLRFLAIRNLAVIDRLELEFESGLNVLTGETGAGKSIIVGAVGLLAGGRATSELVRTGEEQAFVEAIFEDARGAELIIRREVSSQSGRSRAFLNGTLVTSAALREQAARLVDLHGQHEHQVLLQPAAHLDLLDAFAGLQQLRSGLARTFARWQQLRLERDRLSAAERETARRADFVEFQLEEIRRIAPAPGEDAELAAARRILANAERLQRLCADAYTLLYEGDQAALSTLSVVWKRLADLSAIEPLFEPYLAGRDVIKPQLQDLADFLRSYGAGIDASPSRLQEVEDRLAALERLKKKHGPTLDDVIRVEGELARELQELADAGDRAGRIASELDEAGSAYRAASEELSRRRHTAAAQFAKRLEEALGELAMPRTRCSVRFTPGRGEDGWSERGTDEGEFFMSPNPGEDLRPLARIASGGELSRIMLALRTLASTDEPGKTLIFDEVDAGIGGAIADTVGARLRTLADRFQVLCITHLPQIAAHGTTHFRIGKSIRGERTVTDVARLSLRDREAELARMIAGTGISPAVIASAREMLRRNRS